MGIEPTSHTINMQLNGFEDRGHHQVCKHFRTERSGIKIHKLTIDHTPKVA